MHRERSHPIDANDVRTILLGCNKRRLKIYLLILASGATREVEATAIRHRDVDFTTSPTEIHLRADYTKTKVARKIWVSDEATQHLKSLMDWKKKTGKLSKDDDLIFHLREKTTTSGYKSKFGHTPQTFYANLQHDFSKLLDSLGPPFSDRKESNSRHPRHTITFQTLRRFAKTVISNCTNQDFSEWFIGHAGASTYYGNKEEKARKTYADQCMKHLTFLDYNLAEVDEDLKNGKSRVYSVYQSTFSSSSGICCEI